MTRHMPRTEFLRLIPRISMRSAALMFCGFIVAGVAAYISTPRLTTVDFAPNLEDTVPRQFGDWTELPNPYVQVSLSTGNDPTMEQPYDQTLMRSYVNSKGQRVMLALAWGKRQRQEVKIHRPDLCYVAQGYRVTSLVPASYKGILGNAQPINGKHMTAMDSKGGEAVAYWIRIGNLYSENAMESRIHIFNEGIAGRIPDGVLVRASASIKNRTDATALFPVLDQFLADLYLASPNDTRALMARQ